jgi:hypothetical protein
MTAAPPDDDDLDEPADPELVAALVAQLRAAHPRLDTRTPPEVVDVDTGDRL